MNDFPREYELYRPQLLPAIDKCLKQGHYILGEGVAEFETAFAKTAQTKYAVGVGNGMEAIEIALTALGIGPGDEVITVANSAVATALAITRTGAVPVFVDIDGCYHMDPRSLAAAIGPKTKAVLPVHLFGQMADMHAIMAIAGKHNLSVIEDACQAFGARLGGSPAGSLGTAGCFSFYPTKNLGAAGDGGAITTNSEAIAKRAARLRNYGQASRYIHEEKGLNSRLDALHAVMLSAKLPHVHEFVERRRELALLYRKELSGMKQIRLPKERENSIHSYHLFVVEADDRAALQEYLAQKGIESLVHYPIPIHKQPCYGEFQSMRLPRTEAAAGRILSLPIHPFLTEPEVMAVSQAIRDFYAKGKV